jgi:hypothetical protein
MPFRLRLFLARNPHRRRRHDYTPVLQVVDVLRRPTATPGPSPITRIIDARDGAGNILSIPVAVAG